MPQGWQVMEAAYALGKQPKPSDPTSQFFVMRDNVSLFGNEITNPQESSDQSGNPDVTFGFTGQGGNAFQNVTAQIARRGTLVSTLGQQKLFQHFAVALDNQLISVPFIDYTQNPDGIPTNNGADIPGGGFCTMGTASALAQQLRLGALPIKLRLISSSQVSATLGKQALNKGLLAGLIGLILVVVFLWSPTTASWD